MTLSTGSVRLNIVRFSHRGDWYKVFDTLPVTDFAKRAKEENLTSNNYWSSTTNANNSSNAWIVNFNNGNTNNNNKDNNNNNVRCVRAG